MQKRLTIMDWLLAEVGTEMPEIVGGLERQRRGGMMSLQILR
jgi:hypothetical protein